MRNSLVDLQNHLFEMIEKLNDDSLVDEKLEQEIRRALAIGEMAKIAVANGALMLKSADNLYGLPVSDQLPLIPPSPADKPKLVSRDKTTLIDIPKGKPEPLLHKKGNA